MRDTQSATFVATIPPILSAIKISGDGGARIQFDVDDSGLSEVLKLLLMRDELLRITVEPADNGQSDRSRKIHI